MTQPASAPTQTEQPAFATPGFEKIAELLRPYMASFFASASNNVPPDMCGNMILYNIPEEVEPTVIAWLQGPSWFADLSVLEPRISGQTSWWADLRNFLLEDLLAPPDGSPVRDTDDDAHL